MGATYGEKVKVATLANQDKILTNQDKILDVLEENTPKRYGYRIKLDESNPDTRVEYLYDAVGLEPAHMDFESGTFKYGGWGDKWFVTKNYPVVLNRDGSEAYRLDPNDYSKRDPLYAKKDGRSEDDPPSGVTLANLKDGENAMSAIPLCWVKRYQEGGYLYVIFCEEQYDSSYKAYAHTNKNGKIVDYAYHAIYEGYLDNCSATDPTEGQAAIITGCKYKTDPSACTLAAQCTAPASCKITDAGCKTYMRSVSGVQPTCFTTADWEVATARRNGEGWDVAYWSLKELIADLLTLMSKSTNSEAKFGQGHTERNASADNTKAAMMMKTGTMDKKGQFWGSTSTKPTKDQAPGDPPSNGGSETGVKVFHIEHFYGDRWDRIAGLCARNGDILVKMTPEGTGYNTAATGYVGVAEAKTGSAAGSGWRSRSVETEYGSFPVAPFDGSDATYDCDYFWFQTDGTVRVGLFGGSCFNGSWCGARYLNLSYSAAVVFWNLGASLSFVRPS